MGAMNQGQQHNLNSSISHDAHRFPQNPASTIASHAMNKAPGSNQKQSTAKGSFMSLSQNSFAQAGKNQKLGMHSATSSISMLPSDLRNTKQLESFERFKKHQADRKPTIPNSTSKQAKTSALLHAKNQQKLLKPQKDSKKDAGNSKQMKKNRASKHQVNEDVEV